MKTVYTYHFNKDELFTCTLKEHKTSFSLKEKQAIESLKLLDDITFDNIQVFKHFIFLSKENYEIRIEDLDLFTLHHLDQYIPKLYEKIKASLKEYLYKEAKKKTKQNKSLNKGKAKKNIFKVSAGAVLMTMFLTSMSLKGETEELSEPLVVAEDFLEENNTVKENAPELNTENTLEENKTPPPLLETTTESLEEIKLSENQENVVYLNYEKTNDLVKKDYTFNEYRELANWCGEKWGISPNLILMQMTQESAGKKENLMQIVWDKWAGDPIRVYNFRDNMYETFLLTNNPTEEEKAKYTCITQEDLKNPKTNMSIGCVLLRKSAEYMEYHIMASLQCYNLGNGNMDKVFEKMYEETGQTKEEILSDQTNVSFYDYTYVPGEGDPQYLSNVFQFIDEYGDAVTFKHLQNGEVVEETIHVYSTQQTL